MRIDNDLILKLQRLARLNLNEAEQVEIQADLNKMLEMVEKLKNLDTSGVRPMRSPINSVNSFRKDEAAEPIDFEQALKNAPFKKEAYFMVPKIIRKAADKD